MSKITLAPNASGSGTLTVAAPNTNTDRTITLPDATGTVNISGLANEVPAGSAGSPSIYSTGDSNTGVFFPAADTVAVSTAGSERMRVDSSGNVGIGTSSPSGAGTTLATQGAYSSIVAGSTSNANFVSFYSGQTADPNPSIVYNNSLRIGSATAPTTAGYAERMRIDSSGNVGIGTSSPSYRVDVASADTTAGTGYAVRIRANATATAGAIQFTDSTAATQNGIIAVDTSSNMKFTTSTTERMRIDSSGNLLVGIAAASYSATSSAFQYLAGSNLVCSKSTTANTNQIVFNNPNGQVGSINTSASATTYNTGSDYRLKENVQPMIGALDTIAQLNPVTYNWKSDGSDGQGFIAHELQAVVPDCVSGEKDAVDDEGNPKYQGVDTSFLVATLVKAVQEQQQMIQALQADIAALKGV